MEVASSTLNVMHIWDLKAGSHRDLHSELASRLDVRSRQCVYRYVDNGAPKPSETFAFHTVPAGQGNPGPVGRALKRISDVVARRRFEAKVGEWLDKTRPSVIHAHFGPTGWWFSEAAVRRGVPLVVSFYGVDVSQMVKEPLWCRRYAALFERAACLVVLCQEAEDRLAALGCPRDRIRVWNHPLNLDLYRYQRRSPQGSLRLITAARFVEKKGYPFLLDACAKLVQEGKDLTLTAVGYGPNANQIEQRAHQLGLNGRFQLIDTSAMSHFDAFYSQILQEHDIFVLPSTTAKSGDDEGGPALSLVLAQAAGLPVVCTPFPGAALTVIDGQTGLFCRQDDATSLAERIGYLADHRELWDQFGSAGNELIRSQFDFPAQVEAMIGIYREVSQ